MELDKQDLREGKKFLVGTWQVDYIVNAFSNDLAHIPASEFKSEDGTDFSVITYEFYEDNTMKMRDTSKGKEESGTWEQTGYGTYHYTLNAFLNIPDGGSFLEAAQTLNVHDGFIVFSLGFLAIAMKKIADGVITEEPKEPDIGDLTPSEADLQMKDICGTWTVEKIMTLIDNDFRLATENEVKEFIQKQIKAGETDEESAAETLNLFKSRIEFSEDHKIKNWMPIPEGKSITKEQIEEAIKAGEIAECRDGYFCPSFQEWKAVNGKYYYNSGEEREVFGEKQSPWDELVVAEDGTLPFGSGFMVLKRCTEG